MPDTSGVYSLPPSYKATSGQTIRTEQHNPPLEDIAQALTNRLPRDGSAPMTGDLAMNNRKITGLRKGTSGSDAARVDQTVPSSPTMTSMSGLAWAANKIAYATSATAAALTDLTIFGRSLIGSSNAADARGSLGLKSGATADKASTAEAQAGTNDTKYMTPRGVTEHSNTHTIGGAGQRWYNMTSQRSRDVVYQNTTGRPIMVHVRGGSAGTFSVSQDNSSWVDVGEKESYYRTAYGIVPAGHYYRCTGTIVNWAELR